MPSMSEFLTPEMLKSLLKARDEAPSEANGFEGDPGPRVQGLGKSAADSASVFEQSAPSELEQSLLKEPFQKSAARSAEILDPPGTDFTLKGQPYSSNPAVPIGEPSVSTMDSQFGSPIKPSTPNPLSSEPVWNASDLDGIQAKNAAQFESQFGPAIGDAAKSAVAPGAEAAPAAEAGAGWATKWGNALKQLKGLGPELGEAGGDLGGAAATAGELGSKAVPALTGPLGIAAAAAYEGLKSTPANADENDFINQRMAQYQAHADANQPQLSQNEILRRLSGNSSTPPSETQALMSALAKLKTDEGTGDQVASSQAAPAVSAGASRRVASRGAPAVQGAPMSFAKVPYQPVDPNSMYGEGNSPADLQAAQEKQRQIMMYANMLKGANQFGAALSHSGMAPENDVADGFIKNAGMPVEQLLQRRKASDEAVTHELNMYKAASARDQQNPNSPVSQNEALMANAMAKQAGFNIDFTGAPASQIHDTLGTLEKIAAAKSRNEMLLEQMKMRQLQAQAIREQQMSLRVPTIANQYGRQLNPNLASNAGLWKDQQILQSGSKIQTLLNGYNDWNDMPSTTFHELPMALNAMLAPGAMTDSGRQSLVQNNIPLEGSKIMSMLTGQPWGAGQKAFIQNFLGTINREGEGARARQLYNIGQIARTQGAPLHGLGDIGSNLHRQMTEGAADLPYEMIMNPKNDPNALLHAYKQAHGGSAFTALPVEAQQQMDKIGGSMAAPGAAPASTVWQKGTDGRWHEFDSATKQPTGRSQ